MLLVHLSDIHFRKEEFGSGMDPYVHIRNVLIRDIADECARLGKSADAILISGDIAFAGHQEEYAFAVDTIQEIASASGTSLGAVFTCPGNHDVVRSIAGRQLIQALHGEVKRAPADRVEDVLRRQLLDEETRTLLFESLGNYNQFATLVGSSMLPPDRNYAVRDLFFQDGSTLRLNGLNSALISSASDAEKTLYVDPSYRHITHSDGVTHLVMCHHPPSWLGNGDLLGAHLDDVAQIQLFGHEHRNRIRQGRYSVTMHASAMHPERHEPGFEPGYNLIEVDVAGANENRTLEVRAHVRVWQENPTRFRAKMDRNSDTFDQSIVLPAWSPQPTPQSPLAVSNPETSQRLQPVDPMATAREIGFRYGQLPLNRRLSIAGELNLFEDADLALPDYERFRLVLARAQARDILAEFERAVALAENERASGQ